MTRAGQDGRSIRGVFILKDQQGIARVSETDSISARLDNGWRRRRGIGPEGGEFERHPDVERLRVGVSGASEPRCGYEACERVCKATYSLEVLPCQG